MADLRAERAAATRGAVAEFCGAGAVAAAASLPPADAAAVIATCAGAVADVLADATAAAAKRAVAVAAETHAAGVRVSQGDAANAAWTAAARVRDGLLTLATGDVGSRAAAAKAVENVVGALVAAAPRSAAAAAAVAECATRLGAVLPAATASASSPVGVSLVRAVAAAAVVVADAAVPPLVAAASPPPVHATVKAALADALTGVAKTHPSYGDAVAPALRSLGVEAAEGEAAAPAAPAPTRSADAPPSGEPAPKRQRSEIGGDRPRASRWAAQEETAAVAPPVAPPPPAPLPPSASPPLTPPANVHHILATVAAHASRVGGAPAVEAFIRSLPPGPLADAVLAAALSAPPAVPPPPHGWWPAGGPLAELAGALGLGLDGGWVAPLSGGGGGVLPQAHAPPPPPSAAKPEPPPPKPDPVPPPVVAPAAAVIPLAAIQMDARARRSARRNCYGRLLAAPRTPFRDAALARLAADEAVGDGLSDQLLAWLAAGGRAATAEGKDVALAWLSARFAADAVGDATTLPSPPPGGRYEAAVTAVLAAVADAVGAASGDADKVCASVLLGAPALPPGAVLTCLTTLTAASSTTATVALAAARDVALHRPPARGEALDAVVAAAASPDTETRGKAVRLATNRLLPEPALAVGLVERARARLEAGLSVVVEAKEEEEKEAAPDDGAPPADDTPAPPPPPPSPTTVAAAAVELYCALVTRSPDDLLPGLLAAVGGVPRASPGRAAVMRLADNLARTLGAAAPALKAAVDAEAEAAKAEAGAEGAPSHTLRDSALLLKLLYAATEHAPPPADLAASLLTAADATGDGRLLPPAVGGLSRDGVVSVLPSLAALHDTPLRAALARALGPRGPGVVGPSLTPAELLEALATLDAASGGGKAALARARAAVNAALALPGVFTPADLAAALSRLLTRAPLPPLYMRLLIQALAAAPSLRGFVVETLAALAARTLWSADAGAWRGWLLAARAAAPDSFAVVLSLPTDVLASALHSTDGAPLRAPLTDYARLAGGRVAVPPATKAMLDTLETEAAAARGM